MSTLFGQLGEAILFHLASGQAFFSGAAILILAAVGSGLFLTWAHARRRFWLVGAGAMLIVLSATPQPIPYQVALAAITIAWIVAECRVTRPSGLLKVTRCLYLAAWIAAIGLEAPFHAMPRLPAMPGAEIGILGDSVTAGMGENEAVTWPNILRERHLTPIHNHSRMGATVESAQKRGARLSRAETLVIVELGGNDMLGNTSAADFERGLDELLSEVRRPGRVVVMFELPLPPTYNRFGFAQRRLAKKHGVHLIPKRRLLAILRENNATLDSLHLSTAGHERMAALVWEIVGPAVEPGK